LFFKLRKLSAKTDWQTILHSLPSLVEIVVLNVHEQFVLLLCVGANFPNVLQARVDCKVQNLIKSERKKLKQKLGLFAFTLEGGQVSIECCA
jgi:hypothetical protein